MTENISEDENKEVDREELNLTEEVLQRNSENEERSRKLELKLQEIAIAYKKHMTEFWKKLQWDNYLYGAKEMDYFQLPVINAFLSEWKDDEKFDETLILKECRACLKIVDTLNFAISVCAHASEKQQNLWKEGIKNLNETVMDKLNYLSFMLLKNGKKYINPKTQNVEYGIKDDDEDCLITLCLWANLYTAVRKQGMSMLGFSFKVPIDIVQENCAVRIMHTLFDQISMQNQILHDKEEHSRCDADVSDNKEQLQDRNKIMESKENTIKVIENEKENEITFQEQSDLNNETENKNESTANNTKNENELSEIERKKSEISEDETTGQTKHLSTINLAEFDSSLLPPLTEPDIQIVDPDEYFIVGGAFHFDLYVVPRPNVRKGNVTYIHREKPELKRILYKRKIVPPRIFDDDIPHVATAYEKMRFRHELENAIFIQLQLPEKVMYLSTPEPARLFLEKGGYSTDCIFCVDYKKDSRQISFKTNQFGIFGILQKKYQNLPYKKWTLKACDSVILSLIGSKLDIDITINIHGYTVTLLHPDDHLMLPETDSTWMACDLLMQKLLAVGINIAFNKNSDKFASISKKEKLLEDNVYDCIALLCACINFTSIPKLSLSENEIALEYTTKQRSEVKRVLIAKNKVMDYKEEEGKNIKVKNASEINIEIEKSCMDNAEIEKTTEEQVIENNSTEALAKAGKAIQETEKEPIFQDLYHYVLYGMNEEEKEAVMNTNACLIEHIRTLLKLCRPISSM